MRDTGVPWYGFSCADNGHSIEKLGRVPIHSLKSYFGHSFGACGAIKVGWDVVDDRCAPPDYVMGAASN